MIEKENLTRLASSLSLEERHNLLERLTSQSTMVTGSLYFDESDHGVFRDFRQRYASLPWYSRFWLFLQSLLVGKTPVSVFEDGLIVELGRKIEATAPGIYDYQNSRLLTPFHIHLNRLKEAARFFFDALEVGFDRDKGAFYAFLASLEMPEVHKKLISGTKPQSIAQQNPDASEAELHRFSLDAMEKALGEVTEQHRQQMYSNARALLCLKQLSSFLFDRLMLAFTHDPGTNSQSCPVHAVKDQLISLNNTLFSLKTAPSMSLLESLFIFLVQERAGEPGFEINREIRVLLAKAEGSLIAIMEFNRQIPLTKIIRCGTRDMSIAPHETPGGEDWFLSYRDHWRHFVDKTFAEFIRSRRQDELLSLFKDFFGGSELRALENVASSSNPDGFPLKGDFGLSFLLTFYEAIFIPDLSVLLRPILVDGEFINKENEMEFADSYNEFMKLENDILHLDTKIGPDGDFGARLKLAHQEVAALPVKRRKIQIVIEEASAESLGLTDGIRKASRSLIGILQGITAAKDEHGVNYNGISNLAKIAGKGDTFANSLKDAVYKFESVIKIIDDINIMEAG